MRVRVVLGVMLALVAAGVLTTLSVRRPHLAGTSHVRPLAFHVRVPAGATACQPGTALAPEAVSARLLVATNGQPMPPLSLRFTDAGGKVVARGAVSGGQSEGPVTVPFERPVGKRPLATTACIRNRGERVSLLLGGDVATAANGARVGEGRVQGVVAFAYPRELSSWWPLLGGVAERFGRGKAALFGTWTLPALAAALLAIWAAAIRLLAAVGRER